jgi:signal transduction histidine kinase
MKIFRSIAFRIWLIFTGLGLLISIPLALYYNEMQLSLLQEHTREEFNVNARITSNAVKTALEMDDYGILRSLLNDIEKSEHYTYVAIAETFPDGEKMVVACAPRNLKNRVLRFDTNKYYYSRSPISTSVLKGEIIIASSRAQDLAVLKKLNRPLIYLTLIALVASTLLFGFSVLFLSRPIFRAIEIAKALGSRDYSVEIKTSKGTDEISVLNQSLFQLRQNLVDLNTQNKDLMDGLEERIEEISVEIENKNQLNKLLLDISRTFLESTEDADKNDVVRETLGLISANLGYVHLGIFKVQDSGLQCQYNDEGCPLKQITDASTSTDNGFDSFNPGLNMFTRENADKKNFIGDFFNALPDIKSIVLYRFIGRQNEEEILVMLSVQELSSTKMEELEDMINVYFSLYTNFRKGKEFELELRDLNKTLEAKVLEKTRVNLEISNSLIAQDKLVTIGELAAGVAHDLNTPLASIKAASQNMRMVQPELFTKIQQLSTEELNFILETIKKNPDHSIFRGSIEKLQFASIIKEKLEKLTGKSDEQNLAMLVAEAGFLPENDQFLLDVIQFPNPETILRVTKDLFMLNSFLDGIESSVDRSSEVISNLSKFIREDLTQKKEQIDLSNSLRIVEALFRFRLRGNIDLTIDVPPGLKIMGIEMKLFQVWTNLVKNAIDAFEDQPIENKYIRIFSTTNEDLITIHFENNGPQIPEEDVQRIFKKFFTTKQKRNGTGLGLSIVSNIIAEHYGKLALDSSEQKTTFSISFPKA